MRKLPTLKSTRRAFTVTALAALLTGGAFLTSGTASAATTLAGSCSGSVTGAMGDTVAVSGASVKELVRSGVRNYVNNHFWTFASVWPDSLADNIGGRTLAVGSVPNSAGGTVPGSTIGSAAAAALKGANGLGILDSTKNEVLAAISSTVAKSCGLTTLANNYVAPSTPNSNPGGQPGGGGTPNTPGGTGGGSLSNLVPGSGGTAPRRDYGNIPTATAGEAVAPGVRYGQNGTLPGDASVPQGGQDAQSGQSGQGVDVRAAGNAESLATPGGGTDDVQLPMLLAVIVLAGVTAGLVRTWVLRRAS